MEKKKPAGIVLGLIIGLVVGLVGGVMVSGIVAYNWAHNKAAKAREGWNLHPVIVASQDMEEGTVLTFDHVYQRSIPEQFVTRSIVRPSDADHIINKKLLVPVKAGDPMLWTHFEASPAKPAPEDQAVGSDSAR
ncbi:SAF domain-containing protein [Archangium gephyra]|uniref:SAF domain-containing protein n=1 Tax=Archangium gephyra TaxID=48 RepID=UPI003B7D5C3E